MMNILLPTDFSESSRNAAAYALQFFKEIPCTFHFLHVSPGPGDGTERHNTTIPIEIQKKFEGLLSWLEDIRFCEYHFYQISYKYNYLIEATREFAVLNDINLILMGTNGVPEKPGISIGKNTADVMMKVKCPALIISKNSIYKTHKKILFPTDYKINYSLKMLETLLNLTKMSKASVKILELFNSEKEPSPEQLANKFFLHNSFSPDLPAVQTYYSHKNSDSGSLFKSNENVDMIVMAAKNLALCQAILMSNTNRHPSFLKQLPLLVLHG